MEFRIQKRELLKGLEKTLTIVERRNTMPSLNHALFELRDGSIQISATDLEIFVTSTLPCKTLSQGRMAIPARNVFDIVKECDVDEIHFKSIDSTKIEITAGKSHFKILGLEADSFPHFKASPKGQLSTGKLNCREFVKLIQKTEYAVSTEEIRYFLTGIFIETVQEGNESYIRAVATDGHRLALMDSPQSVIGKLELKKGIIIQKKGATELRKLLESTTEETFEISCDENLVLAKVGDFNLWIRPIDAEFPNYKTVIPASLPATLSIARRDLALSMRKMNLLVSDRSRVVIFDFNKERLQLTTQNPDLGEATDEVPAKYDGAELRTGYNVKFFLDAVNYFDGEQLEIKLGDKLQPALVTSVDNPGYRVIVMPMRI